MYFNSYCTIQANKRFSGHQRISTSLNIVSQIDIQLNDKQHSMNLYGRIVRSIADFSRILVRKNQEIEDKREREEIEGEKKNTS